MSNVSSTTDIAVVTPADVSLAGALHIGTRFTSSAVLSEESYTTRRVTWATGNNDMFAANGKTPLEAARGFLIDMPDADEMFPEDFELCDAMDALCGQGLARSVVVVHLDADKRPVKVPCWQMPIAALFVVCAGVPDLKEMESDPAKRLGVAYAGYRTDGNGKTQSSELHFTAYIKEVMDAGYNGAFSFQFRSYVAPKMLACLKAHEYVLNFVNTLRLDAGELSDVAYYACALPIQVSAKTLTAGSTERGGTKQVHYPVPAIPRLRRNAPEEALAFLARVAITHDQLMVIEGTGRVEEAVAWSIKKTQKLLTGDTGDDTLVPPTDDAPPFVDADIPDSLR